MSYSRNTGASCYKGISQHSQHTQGCARPPECLHGGSAYTTRLCTQRVQFAHHADHTAWQGMHFQEGNRTTGLHVCPLPQPPDKTVYPRESHSRNAGDIRHSKKKKRKLVLSSEPNQTVGGTDIYLGSVRALPRGDAVSKAGRGTANPSTAPS